MSIRLNPCSIGIRIEHRILANYGDAYGLNPCSIGIRIEHLHNQLQQLNERLNPCSIGIRIEPIGTITSMRLFLVLILALLE